MGILKTEITTYSQYDFKGYGESATFKPKKIALHDTGTTGAAKGTASWTVGQMASNPNSANYHFVIDEKELYSVVLETSKAYHCGDGQTKKGNGESLGIEIARSLPGGNFANDNAKEIYYKAWLRACELASDLCKKYNIAPNENTIIQHNECKGTACPYAMKMYFGSYEKAKTETIKMIKNYMNGETPQAPSESTAPPKNETGNGVKMVDNKLNVIGKANYKTKTKLAMYKFPEYGDANKNGRYLPVGHVLTNVQKTSKSADGRRWYILDDGSYIIGENKETVVGNNKYTVSNTGDIWLSK